jgi:lysophospholipid acyltransferase (LPLAT)-like uncharacterized protein
VLKKFSRSDRGQTLLAALIAAYIRLVYYTSRWRNLNAEAVTPYLRNRKPFICAFWHGRMMMMPLGWTSDAKMHVFISRHRDGEVIARTMQRFDIGAVRGSSASKGRDKGALAAIRSLLRVLRAGDTISITPDGPKGPRMRASDGVAMLAKLSGLPIIPSAFSASRRIVLNSWDSYVLALPFSRGVFIWGDPIFVPADADAARLEAARLRIETSLNDLTAEADRLCGQSTIAAAPIAADESRQESSADPDCHPSP